MTDTITAGRELDLYLNTDVPQTVIVYNDTEEVWKGDLVEYGALLDHLRGIVKFSPADVLGNRYHDPVSEFKGHAIEVNAVLGGSVQVRLESVVTKDNVRRTEWFPLDRLDVLEVVPQEDGLYL